MGIFPNFPGENKQIFELPPPSEISMNMFWIVFQESPSMTTAPPGGCSIMQQHAHTHT